tara:strand:- start:8921 stop:9589 length:669 start_codon:yes stop_codon:yes gene_type:complete
MKEYSLNSDGKIEGEMIFYDKEGNIKDVINYKNGSKEGEAKGFYTNGQLRIETNFKNNLQNGTSKEYYKNGGIESILKYKDGVKYGDLSYYYKEGSLKMKATSNNDTTVYYKEYSKEGEMIDFYRKVDIIPKLDTVTMGENFDIHVKIFGSIEDIKEVMYLNTYIGIEDSEFITLEGIKHEYEIPIPTIGEGRQLLNIRILEKDTSYTRLYYDMYVKPKKSS